MGTQQSAKGHPSGGMIALHSIYEFILTTALLFVVVSAIRWIVASVALPNALSGIQVRTALVGLVVTITLVLLIQTPWGRQSGGHLNPAISVAMWLFGVFPREAVAPYMLAQLGGSVLGAAVARLVLGPVVAQPPTLYGVVQPAPGWTDFTLFLAETATMCTIILIVGLCLTSYRIVPYLPCVVGVLVGDHRLPLGLPRRSVHRRCARCLGARRRAAPAASSDAPPVWHDCQRPASDGTRGQPGVNCDT